MSAERVSRPAVAFWASLHALLLAYAFPPAVVFGATPYGSPDYQTHYQHTRTLLQAWRELGRLWVYDPNLLAGYPAGLFFDVDNKAHFLFSAGLHALGVPLPVAFNLFALLSSALAPVVLALAARAFDLAPRAQLAAFALGVLVWHMDATLRFCWGGGMISFVTAAHVCVLVVALMWRMLHRPRPGRSFAALLVLLPLALLLHVWSFALLVVPLVALYLASARGLPATGHARVWALAAAGLVLNLYWLAPALARRELLTPSDRLGQASPAFILYDYLELLVDPLTTGFIAQRTLFRALALVASVLTLIGLRRARDPRTWALGLWLGWAFALTYFAALVPGLRAMEPYRFAAALSLCAAVVAAPWLSEHVSRDFWRGLPGAARTVLVALALLLAPRVAQQVMSFYPEVGAALTGVGPAEARGVPAGLALAPTSLRLRGVPEDWVSVKTWLEDQPPEGRVLVHYWPLAEYLRGSTELPLLGGFPDRRTVHEAANLFHFPPTDPRWQGEGLAEYLERYAVAYVVMTYPHVPALEQRKDLFEPRGIHGGQHRIYRVRRPSGYVAEGRGEVRAGLGTIEVRGAAPAPGTERLVLRFHWLDELRCAPNCRLERVEVPGDPAGFIAVIGEPTLPAALTISQAG